MILTFVAHSTRFPSGGIRAVFEFANAMSRRGHDVNVVHRPNLKMRGGWVRSLDDIKWVTFERGISHVFEATLPTGFAEEGISEIPRVELLAAVGRRWSARDGDLHRSLPRGDFVFAASMLPDDTAGLPVLFVQGDLVGSLRQRKRLRSPCPKVCVARWLVELGREEGVPEEQLLHVPCGVDHDRYRVTRPLRDRPMQVAMLYSDHPKKGSALGLAALREVTRRAPGVRVVVFGARAPKDSLPDFVEFYADPPQDLLVEEIYNGSRVFLQPSFREGFGLTSVEAMACGAALVTTANGGSDDFAVHDETALVTPPGDVDAMADAVHTLLLDEALRLRVAGAGGAKARSFDWDLSAERLERFLCEYAAEPERFRRRAPVRSPG